MNCFRVNLARILPSNYDVTNTFINLSDDYLRFGKSILYLENTQIYKITVGLKKPEAGVVYLKKIQIWDLDINGNIALKSAEGEATTINGVKRLRLFVAYGMIFGTGWLIVAYNDYRWRSGAHVFFVTFSEGVTFRSSFPLEIRYKYISNHRILFAQWAFNLFKNTKFHIVYKQKNSYKRNKNEVLVFICFIGLA